MPAVNNTHLPTDIDRKTDIQAGRDTEERSRSQLCKLQMQSWICTKTLLLFQEEAWICNRRCCSFIHRLPSRHLTFGKVAHLIHAKMTEPHLGWNFLTSATSAVVASLIFPKKRPLLSLSPSPSLGNPESPRASELPCLLGLPVCPPPALHVL